MTRILHCIVAIYFLIAISAVAANANWQAGAAKVNITPKQTLWMAGYGGRNHPAEGKLTDLWAKALVLKDGEGHQAVLVTLDLIGIDQQLSKSVCGDLAAKFQLRRDQIALCTSHTHTGPVVGKNLRPMHYELINDQQKKLVDKYAVELKKNIVAVVGQAIEKLAPASLTWGSGTASFAVNRRENRPESNVPKWRAEGKLKGPVDHDVPVLAVRDSNGKLKAVAFGYACHCTVLSFYQWSGDYAGFAQIELEKAHPDCVALFWAGCGADQNPLPRRQVELAKDYGRQLAKAVDEVLSKKMKPVGGSVTTTYKEIALPLSVLPTIEQVKQDSQSKNKFVAARAKMFLADIAAGKPLPMNYPFPVQSWRIGDEIQFITLGGEVVVDFAIRLKTELRGKRTWVAAYSNDVMAYIPSRRVLREGGYEGGGAMVYYGLPTTWAPDVEKLIIDEVHRQLKRNAD
ncbi:MAG: neutral/alkaline non-lysosomal ceramidase N-terminal domain-containing protein [Planctomycetes bacterium]|nr:neutral/alkaline non-lysosomal ceramidase N-terminal domain-containing protein [Planctomycetota bacterium]